MNDQPLDLKAFEPTVLKYASEYKPTMNIPEPPQHPLLYSFKTIITGILTNTKIRESKYWSKYGIRMETSDEFKKCVEKFEKHAKLLGSGFYGSVFKTKPPSCVKNVPKGTTYVAIKIESFKFDSWGPSSQTAPRVADAAAISKIAGKLNIGPKFYDCFIMFGKAGDVQIVKVFEYIEGKSWTDMKWKSSEKKADAIEQLSKKIKKLNNAGIIHHDLHQGNVMVSKANDVYIVDFDLARFSKSDESNRISAFNESKLNELAPNNLVNYIYNRLIEDKKLIF